MIAVAGAGLALNRGVMWGLRAARHHDINIRSAFVHMLGDLVGLIGIIIGAIVIRYTGWQEIDPLLSILIGVLIIWTAWDIIKESLNILLEGLPRGLELQSVVAAMRSVEGVLDVHDLHIWRSEEHTSELQSHLNLVCRLLLEKKKNIVQSITHSSESELHTSSPNNPVSKSDN